MHKSQFTWAIRAFRRAIFTFYIVQFIWWYFIVSKIRGRWFRRLFKWANAWYLFWIIWNWWAVLAAAEISVIIEKHFAKFSEAQKTEFQEVVNRVRKLKKEILAKKYAYPEIIDQVEIWAADPVRKLCGSGFSQWISVYCLVWMIEMCAQNTSISLIYGGGQTWNCRQVRPACYAHARWCVEAPAAPPGFGTGAARKSVSPNKIVPRARLWRDKPG